MYLGSVRFYKHLIYFIMIILVVLIGLGLYRLCSSPILAFTHSVKYAWAQSETGLSQANGEGSLESGEAEVKAQQTSGDSGLPAESSGAYDSSLISYQSLYPDLYSKLPPPAEQGERTAYLTFDDGPSVRTLEILDIMKEENVKATFFVVTGNADLDLLKRIQEEGHTIAIHSNTHKYLEIYNSVDDFLEDFHTAYSKIYDATSVSPQIFRFPGGSINAHNQGIYQELIAEMLRRGFLFYDWNVSSQDAVSKISSADIVHNVTSNIRGQNKVIILMHDSSDKTSTVKALPQIIKFLKEENYTLDRIDNSIKPIMFTYK